jgi:hypothetical protein
VWVEVVEPEIALVGVSVSAFIPWLIALRVVSLPATTSRMKNEPNSWG